MLIKVIINLVLINILVIGIERRPSEYDAMLMAILIIYTVADIIAVSSFQLSSIPYAIGHVLFIILIFNSTYISKFKERMIPV